MHSTTDKSTVGFLVFMWETMVSLANRPSLLKLTVHCTGPKAVEAITGKDISNLSHRGCPADLEVHAVHVPKPTWMGKDDPMAGSAGHAACVEHALSLCDDGDIHVIVDSDTVVMAKGWDDYLRIKVDEGVGLVGVTYEDTGGFSSGKNNAQTYKNIPNVVWMSMSPKHSWRNLAARPKKQEFLSVDTAEKSKIYNLPAGTQVLRDVAWQIPQYLHDNKITYEAWRQLKPSKDAKVLKGLSDYHEEYHVDGRPFVVHHRGSSKHVYRGDRVSRSFYDAVDAWLRQEADAKPQWLWKDTPVEDRTAYAGAPKRVIVSPNIAAVQASTRSIDEWLKVTVDGIVTRSRHEKNLGSTIDLQHDFSGTHHVRLEGPTRGLIVNVPAMQKAPYLLCVRNLTQGLVTVRTTVGDAVDVPADKNWMLIIDVDGVAHVE